VTWHGRRVVSAIWKEPVAGEVAVAGVNLDGDAQADLRVHGGDDKAVYAYASEDYDWWSAAGFDVGPGVFGDNLTTAGIDVTGARVGDRWQIGTVVFEVAQPRQPCFKLGMRMGDAAFVDRFDAARRPGAYLRIVEPGTLRAGDRVTVGPAAEPTVGILELFAGEGDDLLARVQADARVPRGWVRALSR